jgi:hypothetical protein
MLNIGIILALFSSVGFSQNTVEPAENGAVIVGTLKGDGKCAQAPAQAWLSMKEVLFYHAEVPVNGTFEFHAIPGTYNLVVTGKTGCFVEKEIMLGLKQVQNITLVLKSSQPKEGVKK